ncbi:MAG: enoyl-CoA hydratase-related protein [Acidimicrobiia bacterium]|nr:enoyl-CoA hydratase-related protein [Acidimicrobiia bacterium]
MTTAPQLETVLTTLDDRVGVITLHRPEALNAWNGALSRDLDLALRWAADDDDVGAVVITGAGRAFCAGADLSSGGETFARNEDRGPTDDSRSRTPQLLPWDVPKPVIAAINGHAVGVGATYALACDLRVVAADAKIGFVFSRRGMLPELGSHAVLPRVVGFSNAADLLLSGRPITGEEAASIGLASVATAAETVVPLAVERARDMAINGAPMSMAVSKRLLWESMGVTEMMGREQPLFDWIATQPDSVEGVESFLEKRAPSWKLSVADDFPSHLFSAPAPPPEKAR